MAGPGGTGNATAAGPVVDDVLDEIARAGLWRELRCVERLDGCRVSVDGRPAVSFASCDYLGLASHPRLGSAAADAARSAGTSSTSARLLAGHDASVAALERELAATFGAEAALVFGAGYLANVGVIGALAGSEDLLVSDRLSHASTVDACRLSRARVSVFAHNDVEDLRRHLTQAPRFRRTLVLVEGVYSMDGDVAPLADIVQAADEAGAWVVVDDAHGLGAFGPGGRGAAAAAGVADRVAVQIGNLGKALGSYGAFALLGAGARELLVQTARSFVFTCALPPPVLAAAREGLSVLRDEPARTRRLADRARVLREALVAEGLRVPPVPVGDVTPIVPVMVGDGARSLAISRTLLQRGWLVPAVRPPTVPEGSCRLRLTASAEHSEEQCRAVARDAGAAFREVIDG